MRPGRIAKARLMPGSQMCASCRQFYLTDDLYQVAGEDGKLKRSLYCLADATTQSEFIQSIVQRLRKGANVQ